MNGSTVSIIGAGIAGLACARVLSDAGVPVALFDKGRGPGGRLSTRRTPFGRFDHGAQFFTVRDPDFEEQVEAWREAGLVAPWDRRFGRVEDGALSSADRSPRFVGTPKMNAFIAEEAAALGAQFGMRIGTPCRQGDGRWCLYTECGHCAWKAEWMVLAVPAEQAAELLCGLGPRGSSKLAGEARAARSAPTWTLMAQFEGNDDFPFDAVEAGGPVLDWISRDASKPGREGAGRWVAHATSEWSRDHLEASPCEIVSALTEAFRALTGIETKRVFADAHRWRYARVTEAAGTPFGLDAEARLAACGDWRLGPRIESAWISGRRLGEALLERL
ncbi:NAD(P)/FAD-dependent oxidoreductase [Parvularcula oceani]|uniref:NAD(P)/FAD-dependent oxidoreductase n=1 Tax=Parvularcula oceani TaxID=1247963 RepID=UPI0004E0C7A9|nr:NAD(P)-binding protein [Parvularcula oceani]